MLNADLHNQAKKFLKKCDGFTKVRISKKIGNLLENPNPNDMKVLNTRYGNLSRVRVGDYRILYKVDWDDDCLTILFIEKRSKIYGFVKDDDGEEYGEN